MGNEKLKTGPYKLCIRRMTRKLLSKSPKNQIIFLRNIMELHLGGFVAVTDLLELLKVCTVNELHWKFHIVEIRREESLFSYSKLLQLAEKAGLFKIDQTMTDMVTMQLEAIYKDFM